MKLIALVTVLGMKISETIMKGAKETCFHCFMLELFKTNGEGKTLKYVEKKK